MFQPDFIAPVVGYLVSEGCAATGTVHEVMAGWAAEVRWERTVG